MSRRSTHLAIDARPRGPRGLMAAEVVLGRTMIDHLAELAAALSPPGQPVAVHACPEDHRELGALIGARGRSTLVLVPGAPRDDAVVLRTDRFYDLGRLRRRMKRGGSSEAAALWRIDRPEALLVADEELTHRLTYQPLGKYWAFPIARRLAELLRPTAVRPNAVTLVSAALMLCAAGLVAGGASGPTAVAAIAGSLAAALVLDTADGMLARLQGTCSAFGRWLDEFLDELVDLALHAAIAWSAFLRDGRPVWLLLGMLYVSGKYLFRVESSLADELGGANRGPHATLGPARIVRDRGIRGLVRLAGHADIRWHLWILLAALGRLDLGLVAYAIYFPARTMAGAIRRGWHHG